MSRKSIVEGEKMVSKSIALPESLIEKVEAEAGANFAGNVSYFLRKVLSEYFAAKVTK